MNGTIFYICSVFLLKRVAHVVLWPSEHDPNGWHHVECCTWCRCWCSETKARASIPQFGRHEPMAVKMATLIACHHSMQKKPAATHVATKTDGDAYAVPATGLVSSQFPITTIEAPQVVDSFFCRKTLLHSCTTKSIKNKLLQHYKRKLLIKKFQRLRLWSGYRNELLSPSECLHMSVCNSTPQYKLCTCQSLKPRSRVPFLRSCMPRHIIRSPSACRREKPPIFRLGARHVCVDPDGLVPVRLGTFDKQCNGLWWQPIVHCPNVGLTAPQQRSFSLTSQKKKPSAAKVREYSR